VRANSCSPRSASDSAKAASTAASVMRNASEPE
jgi:hypothetical protein